MGVQEHLFVIELGIKKELLKLRMNARAFTNLLSFIVNCAETITCMCHVGKSHEILSSMFEGMFLECKNFS